MLRYLTNKIEGTAPTNADMTSYKTPDPKPKTVRMWACDVCKKTFPDFDQACRHEEQCRRNKQEEDASKASAPVVHNDLDTTAKQQISSASSQVKSSQGWSCDVCQKAFDDYDEACRHEEKCREKRRKQEAKASSSEASKPVHPFFAKDAKTKAKSKKRAQAKPVIAIDEAEQETTPKTRKRKASKKQTESTSKKARPTKGATGTEKKEKKAATKTSKKARGKQAAAAPIADIFASNMGASQIMAEHKAAEFVAKRRADAERERQRQKRRQEQKQQKKKASSAKAFESAVKNKPSCPPEVRFPVPSHVATAPQTVQDIDLPDSSTCWIDQDSLSEAQGRLGKTLRHAGSDDNKSSDEPKDCTSLLPTNNKPSTTLGPLQHALSELLVPPENVSSSTEAWCDKYTIQNVPEDVCGERNQETARELLKFVDEWKVERGRAHERRAEKQRALLKSKKKKRRFTEDDIWEDSDDEDGGLCSVCLLTGPTGSGKTSLVHAVAQQSECKVLEINTTERRGAQALKNAIEEATQSDSSLDMLKKTQIASDEDPLCDSDDEEEETATKSSSIIVVLIDEVDIMFEDEGDSGFWTSMSTLTKKAKCPIFLTANAVPDSLLTSHIRYLHMETSSPEPEECVSKMRRILKSEGLNRTERFSESSAAKQQLSLIAQLCKCDLRRVINELQLFATAPPVTMDSGASPMECESSKTTSVSVAEYFAPIICDISPKEVSPHDLSLLTIKGKNFKLFSTLESPKMALKVSIGNQLCPAVQVLDDSTILAVCPPCALPSGVADSGVIEMNGRQSRTSRFAPVSIHLHAHGRVLSSSDADVTTTTELCDSTPYTSFGRQWNIEYAFPPPRYGMLANQSADSDEESAEAEFGCEESTRKAMPGAAPTETASQREYTSAEAAAVLQEGVRKWRAANSESDAASDTESTCARVITTDAEAAQALGGLSSLCELSSDAAFLEDALEFGCVPFLAGVVPGFGSSLINDVAGNSVQGSSEGNERKLLRDANARPPNFERLFSLGWNEDGCFFGNNDAYMRYPSSTNERQLLARSESLERGLPQALSAGTSDPYQDDDDHHDPAASESLADALKLQEAPRRVSGEDMLVRPTSLSSMLSLPNDLRQHVVEAGHKLIRQAALACLPSAIEGKACRLARLLSELLEEERDPNANRLLCDTERLSETTIVPLGDRMDAGVFLDYLPMLCNMSLHERAAEHAFQQMRESDPETAAAMTGRGGRTTRQSGKTLERRHYFVTMRSCTEDSVANAIGSELAKEVLHYSTK